MADTIEYPRARKLTDRPLSTIPHQVVGAWDDYPHLDADWLTLRVFDSATAATRPRWTDRGKTREAHLLAELRRNTAGPGEWLEVRGQKVDL